MLAGDVLFREARWRRAGASDRRIEQLRAAHADMTVEERAAEGQRIDMISDDDLATELSAGAEDVTAGTVDEVLARVGDDPELAAVALSKEQAKSQPRKGVVDRLTAVIEAARADD